MVVIGIDPSNQHTGLACVAPAPELARRLVAVEPVVMLHGDDGVERSILERIRPTIDRWTATGPAHLWVEEAPPTARGDVHHGPQGAIGFAQGWLAGAVTGPYMGRHGVHRVNPSPWRDHMLVEAARAGFLLQEPRRGGAPAEPGRVQRFKVDREGSGFVKVWNGCDHRETFANYASLQMASAATCPTCAAGVRVPRGTSEADAIREAWKETACRFVARFWPAQYTEIVAAARTRAKVAQPDHRLGGVADACEAVGIALYGLAQVSR